MPFHDWRRSGEICEETGPHWYGLGGFGGKIQDCCLGIWGIYGIEDKNITNSGHTTENLLVAEQEPNRPFAIATGAFDRRCQTLAEWERDPGFVARRASLTLEGHGGPHSWEAFLPEDNPRVLRGIIRRIDMQNVEILRPCCLEYFLIRDGKAVARTPDSYAEAQRELREKYLRQRDELTVTVAGFTDYEELHRLYAGLRDHVARKAVYDRLYELVAPKLPDSFRVNRIRAFDEFRALSNLERDVLLWMSEFHADKDVRWHAKKCLKDKKSGPSDH